MPQPWWLLSVLLLAQLQHNGSGGAQAFTVASQRLGLRSARRSAVCTQSCRRPRAAAVCMMAKKKRGPAGSASLEALEVSAAHVFQSASRNCWRCAYALVWHSLQAALFVRNLLKHSNMLSVDVPHASDASSCTLRHETAGTRSAAVW
jgi:hypothetical protein